MAMSFYGLDVEEVGLLAEECSALVVGRALRVVGQRDS